MSYAQFTTVRDWKGNAAKGICGACEIRPAEIQLEVGRDPTFRTVSRLCRACVAILARNAVDLAVAMSNDAVAVARYELEQARKPKPKPKSKSKRGGSHA